MKREMFKSVQTLCIDSVTALYLTTATAQVQAAPSDSPSAGMHKASMIATAVDMKMSMRKL